MAVLRLKLPVSPDKAMAAAGEGQFRSGELSYLTGLLRR